MAQYIAPSISPNAGGTSWLLSCFGSKQAYAVEPKRASEDAPVENCPFCSIVAADGFKIVYENERVVVIEDRSPAAEVHLLAITKRHIGNVRDLDRSHVGTIRELDQVGRKILTDLGVEEEQQRLGFHIPPFYSVNHLHLHLLSLPLNKGKELKYRPSIPTPVAPPYSETGSYRRKEKVKSWSWFVEATQVIRILEGGKKVALRPVSVMVGQGERL